MDRLVNPLFISIVAGLLTLALWLKRKSNDEVLSEINPKRNDKSNKKEKKNEMETLEQRAQQIIKQHFASFPDVPSYEEVKNELGYTGFMHIYLRHSVNFQTTSTTADYTVTVELASIDKFRDHNTTFNSH